MAFTFGQSTSGSVSSGTSVTSDAFAAPPTTGRLLLAYFGSTTNRSSDLDWPAGWIYIAGRDAGGHGQPIGYQELRYKIAGASEPSTVTVTYPAASEAGIEVAEYSVTGGDPVIRASSQTWDDLATVLPSFDPTDGEPVLMVHAVSNYTATDLTPSGFTTRETEAEGSTTWRLADRIEAVAAGPYTDSIANPGSPATAREYVRFSVIFGIADPEPQPGAILLDVFDTTSGAAVYQGTVTDAINKLFQVQKNGEGTISFKLRRDSANAPLIVADRLVKIRVPAIHSDYITCGFIDAPTTTVISTGETGGEVHDVKGRGGLSYWANAIWLSDEFVEQWWDCTSDPPSNATGQVRVNAGGGPQAKGKYRFYTIAGGVITTYTDDAVSPDACWYYNSRKTYDWPSANSDRFLVKLLTGPHTGDYFHPHQQGVKELRKTLTIGDKIELATVGSTPGAVLRYMYDAAGSFDRAINPLPLMTVDFTSTHDSNGDAWSTSDALAGITVDVGETYLETIAKLLATGVIDVEMGPDLDMHAYNYPRGRVLTSATYAAGKVRFQRGTGDGTGNIADQLDRQARDVQVATFSEVAGTEDTYVSALLPSPGTRVPREVSIRAESNDETALEALGLADLAQRLGNSDAVGFNITVPRTGVSPDDTIGLYLPGPRDSDNGKFWPGDTVRLDTGSGPRDFNESNMDVDTITVSEDNGGNLRCMVEVGTALARPGNRRRPGRYGWAGLTASPGTGRSGGGSFATRPSSGGTGVGAIEIPDLSTHTGDTTDAHDASAVSIADAGSLFTATEAEAALQELAKKDIGVTAHGNMGATETFDALTAWHSGTFNANCTFTFTGATSGLLASMVLELVSDGTSTATWPGSVVWPGGSAPTLSATPGEVDIIPFFSRDGGTTWYGFPTGSGGSALTVSDEGTPLATDASSLDFVGAGVTASGTGAAKTITIPGTPTGTAGGDLSGTYPNPSVVDDSHSHTSATLPTGIWRPLMDGAGAVITDGATGEAVMALS